MTADHTTPDHAVDAPDESHGSGEHSDESEPLGPIDVYAWGAFILGAGLGLAIAVCIALATRDLSA